MLPLRNHFQPSFVDLRPWMPRIENQTEISSCGASAFASVLEYFVRRQYKVRERFSRLFIYYNARLTDRSISKISDEGAYLSHYARALENFGACEEYFWPFDHRLVNHQPSMNAYRAARKLSIKTTRLPIDARTIHHYVSHGFPVVLGIYLPLTASEQVRNNNGFIDVPHIIEGTTRETEMHAIVICGYDDQNQIFIVRNSWGRRWGLDGHFYLPYHYLSNEDLINWDSAWTLRHVHYH